MRSFEQYPHIQNCRNGSYGDDMLGRSISDCKVISEALRRHPVKRYLEVGVWSGHSMSMCAELYPHARYVVVDPRPRLHLFWDLHYAHCNCEVHSEPSQLHDFTQHDEFDAVLIDGDDPRGPTALHDIRALSSCTHRDSLWILDDYEDTKSHPVSRELHVRGLRCWWRGEWTEIWCRHQHPITSHSDEIWSVCQTAGLSVKTDRIWGYDHVQTNRWIGRGRVAGDEHPET